MVDLWGESGGGKSVTLMVAASVWGRPMKGAYMRDYGATDVGFEAAADFLNDLPLMLDDTSKRDEKTKMRFEEIIYNLCSGKGKTRSNKELGINRIRDSVSEYFNHILFSPILNNVYMRALSEVIGKDYQTRRYMWKTAY